MTYSKRLNQNDYEEIFTLPYEDSSEEKIESLRIKDAKRYRVKTIKSGELLECEIYPLWNTTRGKRADKKLPSRDAQKNLNNKNTKKHVIRLINTNFTSKDIWATFGYDDEHLPSNPKEAKKDMQNYIKRLKTYIKANGLEELKYIYVTEYAEDEKKGKTRVHHHVILNFKDRDVAEEIWKKGGRTHSRRLQPDDYGLEGLARYITKDSKNSKAYTPSRNLKQPKISIADHKLGKGKIDRMVRDQVIAEDTLKKLYEDYKFLDMKTMLSKFVSGAYLYVRMRRNEKSNRKRKAGGYND